MANTNAPRYGATGGRGKTLAELELEHERTLALEREQANSPAACVDFPEQSEPSDSGAPSTTCCFRPSSVCRRLGSLYAMLLSSAVISIVFCMHSITLCFMVYNAAATIILFVYAYRTKVRYYKLLYHAGALYPPNVRHLWQVYRLVTPVFLHGDFIHLAFNLLSMYLVCVPFEKQLVGSVWFLFFYFLTGIAGNLLSATVHTKDLGVGASTSLFGILAAFEVHCRFSASPRFYPMPLQYWLGLIVFHVYLLAFGETQLRIDPWGHLGGFVFGALLGLGVFVDLWALAAAGALFVALAVAFFTRKIPKPDEEAFWMW